MATELNLFISSCLVSQQIKNSPKPRYPLKSLPLFDLFSCLQIDWHEIRLPKAKRQKMEKANEGKNEPEKAPYKNVLVLLDQASQYVTLRATRDQTAATAAKIIYDSIFMQYGCPRYIISDRGSSWLNELFQNFIKLGNLNIMHIKTSPYRPNCNEATELRNLHIIRHLRAYCDNTEEFDKFLPSIACANNAIHNVTLQTSPYFFLYGINFKWPFETALTTTEQSIRDMTPRGLEFIAERLQVMRKIVQENVKEVRQETERIKNVGASIPDFQEGDRVFVEETVAHSTRLRNKKHSLRYAGPFIVIHKRTPSLVKLQHMYTGRQLRNYINVDKLRKLRDAPREVLYNRLRTNHADETLVSQPEQRTLQMLEVDRDNILERNTNQQSLSAADGHYSTPYEQHHMAVKGVERISTVARLDEPTACRQQPDASIANRQVTAAAAATHPSSACQLTTNKQPQTRYISHLFTDITPKHANQHSQSVPIPSQSINSRTFIMPSIPQPHALSDKPCVEYTNLPLNKSKYADRGHGMQETENDYFQLRSNNSKQPWSQSQEQPTHINSGQQSINITTAY
jgi:hypothetical protein